MYAAWREKRPQFRELPPDAEFVVKRPCGMVIGDRVYKQGEVIPKDRFQPYQIRNQYEARNLDVLRPQGESAKRDASPESPHEPGGEPAAPPGPFSTTYGELREQCRNLGLPTWGNKKQLRDRLTTQGGNQP